MQQTSLGRLAKRALRAAIIIYGSLVCLSVLVRARRLARARLRGVVVCGSGLARARLGVVVARLVVVHNVDLLAPCRRDVVVAC
jgi:hypothetical protein